MRGSDVKMESFFCYLSSESVLPQVHPLRPIRAMVDRALAELSPEFDKMYAITGRPSIPPEKLLKGLLLQTFYSVRSIRLLMEQVGYNILFRWFLGLSLDDAVWDHSTFSQNQDRLITCDVAQKFLRSILDQAKEAGLLFSEHFTVDGTLIEACASLKSFRSKKDPEGPEKQTRNDAVDFHGQKRTHETHQSITDPDARLSRKGPGKEAKLSSMGHLLMENRNGLVSDAEVTVATGTAERETASQMVKEISGNHRISVGGDKSYDTAAFVRSTRDQKVTPHVAQNDTRRTLCDRWPHDPT